MSSTYFLLLCLLVVSFSQGLSPDRSDYEITFEDGSGPSQVLTKELLSLDLGYNVLNSEVMRKSLQRGRSLVIEEEEGHEEGLEELLPKAQPLVQNRRLQYPATNWDEEKTWGGPSPFFFPDFGFGRLTRPVSAHVVRRPFRQAHQLSQHSAPSKTFVGDQHQCSTGTCEFFLFCWLAGGLIEGSCGGFLFACCQRPDGGGRNSQAIANKVSFFWTIGDSSFFYQKLLAISEKKAKHYCHYNTQ